ncbi:MAG: hypothetical protein HPY84_16220 [Syntrophobacteraceae bacterium]|nr:hypothetical protein [Syntrophobacteraceae bacterium]
MGEHAGSDIEASARTHQEIDSTELPGHPQKPGASQYLHCITPQIRVLCNQQLSARMAVSAIRGTTLPRQARQLAFQLESDYQYDWNQMILLRLSKKERTP